MVLGKLGEYLDKLIAKAQETGQREVANRLQAMVDDGDLVILKRWVIANHYDAQLLAWGLHSNWLGIPMAPGFGDDEVLARNSVRFANDVESRVKVVFGSGEGSPVSPKVYVNMVSDVMTRYGYTSGARQAGRAGRAKQKTWVRAYPARNPRDWHDELIGTTIKVTEFFFLPGGPNAGALVEAPHDWDHLGDPAEWINCGHACVYR